MPLGMLFCRPKSRCCVLRGLYFLQTLLWRYHIDRKSINLRLLLSLNPPVPFSRVADTDSSSQQALWDPSWPPQPDPVQSLPYTLYLQAISQSLHQASSSHPRAFAHAIISHRFPGGLLPGFLDDMRFCGTTATHLLHTQRKALKWVVQSYCLFNQIHVTIRKKSSGF